MTPRATECPDFRDLLRKALCPPDDRCFCQACRAPAKAAELEPTLYHGKVWFFHPRCSIPYLAHECAAPEALDG